MMQLRYWIAAGAGGIAILGLAFCMIDVFVFHESPSIFSAVLTLVGVVTAFSGLHKEVLRFVMPALMPLHMAMAGIRAGIQAAKTRMPKDIGMSVLLPLYAAMGGVLAGIQALTTRIPKDTNALTSLSIPQARRLANQEVLLSLNGLTNLTPEVAAALAKHKGHLFLQSSLSLNGLATLTPEVAEALASFEGVLHLDRLTTLTPEAAEALAKHKDDLSLDGLTTVTPEVAKALAKLDGGLSLKGLATLTPEAADALAKYKGDLSLDCLTTLSDAAAVALGKRKWQLALTGPPTLKDAQDAALASLDGAELSEHKGHLSLNGLSHLSDTAANAVANTDGRLFLDGLTTLSDAAAEALAKHKDDLSLDGLTTVTPGVAKALAKHKGYLSLNGLTSLSDSAAEALAGLEGGLSLNGLNTLSDAAAEAFGRTKAHLELNGLTTLSEVAADALANTEGELLLRLGGLTSLTSVSLAERLGRNRTHWDKLSFPHIASLSPEIADALARGEGWLELDGLTSITPEVAKSLAKNQGRLSLNGLTSIADDVAEALARHEVLHLPAPMMRQPSNWSGLSINGLSTLSEKAAESLASHKGDLSLVGLTSLPSAALAQRYFSHQPAHVSLRESGITQLSPGAAEVLVVHREGWRITEILKRLTTLTPETAKVLAQHDGDLHLDSLTTLTPEVAVALATHTGGLTLNGLTTLSPEVAALLAARKGDLCLNSLKTISTEVAAALAKYEGSLYLMGLTTLTPAVTRYLRTKRNVQVGDKWFEDWRRKDAVGRLVYAMTWPLLLVTGAWIPLSFHDDSTAVAGIPLWAIYSVLSVVCVGLWAVASPFILLDINSKGYGVFCDERFFWQDLLECFGSTVAACFVPALAITAGIGWINRPLPDDWVGFSLYAIVLIAVMIGVLLYVLPTIIASVRNHPNRVPILLLNYLAGWMFIPWLIALLWASLSLERRDA